MSTFQWILFTIAFVIAVFGILILFGFFVSQIYQDIDEMESGPHDIIDQQEKNENEN